MHLMTDRQTEKTVARTSTSSRLASPLYRAISEITEDRSDEALAELRALMVKSLGWGPGVGEGVNEGVR